MYLTAEDLKRLASLADNELAQDEVGQVSRRTINEWRVSRAAWFLVLLRQTLEFAESTVPYYRAKYARTGLGADKFRRLSELSQFPILQRTEVASTPKDFLSEAVPAETLRHTSGTMGRRLTIYGNRFEAEAEVALLKVSTSAQRENKGTGIMLRVIPAPRRLRLASAVPGVIPMLTVDYNPNENLRTWFDYTDYLAEVLADTYLLNGSESRITFLHMTPPWVFTLLTEKLTSRGINPCEFAVRNVALSGGIPTEPMREMVKARWKATCYCSYSCSEVNGEAIESATDPGTFVTSSKSYTEVLDIDTLTPVEPGQVGLVVLTSLYPFQQTMPLLRYNTGDLAQRSILDVDGAGTNLVEAIYPIGRREHCLKISPRHFIGTTDVLVSISRFPEIPQIPYPRYNLSLIDEAGRKVVLLELEALERGEAAQRCLEESIATELMTVFTRRAGFHSELSFRCKITRKGGLSAFIPVYPDA